MADITNMPGHLIRRLHQISQSVFAEKTQAAGIDLTPVQYAALKTIIRNPGIDQATLAGAIAYDRATIGGVVDRLERKALVQRVPKAQDRRARALTATEVGRQVAERAEPVVTEIQSAMLEGLDGQERSQLIALLDKATQAGNQRSRAPYIDI
ncbi:MAG TPA: transcriptional regulator [Rhodospirillaceae bacterium]|nr:transcriptional regulator [Rhodospirillaceae bacterium]MAX62560.1 transcriptional regulator [Rhodospirillaceae bacterium]MBB56959.1 transcriptional regulator [Rhodospirillaceae bacterium]HAE01417.1 transcriptional regulator [Rhodospirillaceae bacterium]HAJ20451.1 transcriptional regulator [Rhodospirillaceae bacterium]|tara:strand:- start:684 stop:1142 length:459 start_codon:yes stop_codon:yes gene_type:complete